MNIIKMYMNNVIILILAVRICEVRISEDTLYKNPPVLSKSFFLNLVQILKCMSKNEFQICNGYKYIALLKKEQVERECYGFWK